MRRGATIRPGLCLPLLLALALAAGSLRAAPAVPTGAGRSTSELLEEGVAAIEAFHFPRARILFREALSIDPRLMQAHYGLGLAALGQRDRKEAERALKRAAQLAGDRPEMHYALGVAQFVFGEMRAAESDLETAAAADRYFLEAHFALGIVRSMRGDLDEAELSLREALRIDSASAAPRYQLGAVLARRGDLEGALSELSTALGARPGLIDARPEDPILFARRSIRSGSGGRGEVPMPLPMLRPSVTWPRHHGWKEPQAHDPGIPHWFLFYEMALLLEDMGHWQSATDMLQRAVSFKDRSAVLAPVGDRLVDYLPHYHLARSLQRLGKVRDALLHLEIARNEGAAPPETLQALNVLLERERLRPSILVQPIPARTTEASVTVRGVILSDGGVDKVEVGEREAILRPASAADISSLFEDERRPADSYTRVATLFEVSGYPLEAIGPNLIRIRPLFQEPARDGDLVEILVVRMPAGGKSARSKGLR